MDFGLSEEQRLLQETIRRFLDERVPTKRVREILEEKDAHDPETWRGLAELGIVGLLVPEDAGGSGLGMLDAALAAEVLGWGAAPTPFLATSIMTPVALREAGTPDQKREWLGRIASGETCFGVAPGLDGEAELRVEDGRLSGRSLFALDAGAADVFLVAVGNADLALVPADAGGLTVELLTTVDRSRRFGELLFEGVEVDWIGGRGEAAAAIERMLDAGRVALAADTLGSCDRSVQLSVDYAKERKQFGRTIGSFQAVKHMCAEMVAAIEPARSLLWYAAYALDALPDEAPTAAALAKAHLCDMGTDVLRTATETHGGIGFTDEYDLHLWFKRVELNRHLLGSPSLLRERAARLQEWEGA
jgi:alkylation response protein AidB-like acyl-CoA dehydrogenase